MNIKEGAGKAEILEKMISFGTWAKSAAILRGEDFRRRGRRNRSLEGRLEGTIH